LRNIRSNKKYVLHVSEIKRNCLQLIGLSIKEIMEKPFFLPLYFLCIGLTLAGMERMPTPVPFTTPQSHFPINSTEMVKKATKLVECFQNVKRSQASLVLEELKNIADAAEREHFINQLFNMINEEGKEDLWMTLQIVAFRANSTITQKWLTYHARDLYTDKPQTPLTFAANQGNIALVQESLKYLPAPAPQYVNEYDDVHKTALHYASENGHLKIIRFLLTAGANVNAPDYSHGTPLHCAVLHLKIKTAALLLAHGADPSICKESSDWRERGTPLQLADNLFVPPSMKKKAAAKQALINLLARYTARGPAICKICQRSFIEGDVATLLPCGHLFRHAQCHYTFAYCPICPKDFGTEQDETLIVLKKRLLRLINQNS